jgi:hypothetical protein
MILQQHCMARNFLGKIKFEQAFAKNLGKILPRFQLSFILARVWNHNTLRNSYENTRPWQDLGNGETLPGLHSRFPSLKFLPTSIFQASTHNILACRNTNQTSYNYNKEVCGARWGIISKQSF